MNDYEIVDSAFNAIINAPIEMIELPAFFTLADTNIRLLSGDRGLHHRTRRQGDVGQRGGHQGQLMVQHYVEPLGRKDHLVLESASGLFTPQRRTATAPRITTQDRRSGMSQPNYEKTSTALLFVDPYNDFLSEGGKIWPRIKPIAQEVGLIANLRTIDHAVRNAGMPVFIAPHRRWEPGDYEDWSHPNPTQISIMIRHSFARGEWGGDSHPDFAPKPGDVVAKEHWGQSGFANTDLDQQLRQHAITHVIIVGLLANTCIESTARLRWNSATTSLWSAMRRPHSRTT